MSLCKCCQIAQHITSATLDQFDLVRINRGAAELRSLGDRVSGEAWAEVATWPTGPAPVLDLLSQYGRLNRMHLAVAGGDKLIPRQLLVVPR